MATENDDNGSADNGYEAAVDAFSSLLSGDSQDTGTDEKAQRREKPTADEDDPQDDQPDEGADPAEDEDDGAGDDGGKAKGADEVPDAADGAEQDPDAGGADDDPIYAVVIDGKEVEVPVSELAKGYSRTADYTRKTQAVAEERRALGGELQATREAREQYSRGLEQLNAVLEQLMPREPDWDALRAQGGDAYQTAWVDWQRQKQLQQNVENERRAVADHADKEAQRVRERNIATGREWLFKQVPEWADAKKASSDREAIKAYGLKLGFSEADLKGIEDPRAILLLLKAMRYDRAADNKRQITEGSARRVNAKQQPQKRPPQRDAAEEDEPQQRRAPPMKPGTSRANSKLDQRASEATRAKQRHAKVGTIQTAAEVFHRTLLS